MHTALGDAAGAFGSHVDAKLAHVEQKVIKMGGQGQEVVNKVDHIARDLAGIAASTSGRESRLQNLQDHVDKRTKRENGFEPKLANGCRENERCTYIVAGTAQASEKKIKRTSRQAYRHP